MFCQHCGAYNFGSHPTHCNVCRRALLPVLAQVASTALELFKQEQVSAVSTVAAMRVAQTSTGPRLCNGAFAISEDAAILIYVAEEIDANIPYTASILITQYIGLNGMQESDFRIHYDRSDTSEVNTAALLKFGHRSNHSTSSLSEAFQSEANIRGTRIIGIVLSDIVPHCREDVFTSTRTLPPINIDISREDRLYDRGGANFHTVHRVYMMLAFYYATKARGIGHQIAAILVGPRGEVLAVGYNTVRQADSSRHAEVNVIQAYYARNRRLPPWGSRIYTSLECCRMCAAIIHKVFSGRIKVYYGQADPGNTHMKRNILSVTQTALTQSSSALKPVRGYNDSQRTFSDMFAEMGSQFQTEKTTALARTNRKSFYLTSNFLNSSRSTSQDLFRQVIRSLRRKLMKHERSYRNNPNVRRVLFHMLPLLPRPWREDCYRLRLDYFMRATQTRPGRTLGGIANDGHCLFRSVNAVTNGDRTNLAVRRLRNQVQTAARTPAFSTLYNTTAAQTRLNDLHLLTGPVVQGGDEELIILSCLIDRRIRLHIGNQVHTFNGLENNRPNPDNAPIDIYYKDHHFGTSAW